MELSLTFLQRYHDNNEFLDRIITVHETWVAHTIPEIKQAVSALASQWIFLKDEIQEDFVCVDSDVHDVLGQTVHSPRLLPEQN